MIGRPQTIGLSSHFVSVTQFRFKNLQNFNIHSRESTVYSSAITFELMPLLKLNRYISRRPPGAAWPHSRSLGCACGEDLLHGIASMSPSTTVPSSTALEASYRKKLIMLQQDNVEFAAQRQTNCSTMHSLLS